MRLFVALDIDEAIRERLQNLVRRLKSQAPGLRFVGPQTYHITLKFLGETANMSKIRDALRAVQQSAFELSFRGTGFFPDAKRPRVFWAGIHAGAELSSLAHAIDGITRKLGFEPEKGPFTPHLTLARQGSGNPRLKRGPDGEGFKRVAQLLSSEPEPDFGTMTAREFFLYESRLSPACATYTKLERYGLL